MIKNIIQVKLKKGKADELKQLYKDHFKAMNKAGDKVASYEAYIDRNDDTVAYSIKEFNNETDLKAHNDSDALGEFLGELKKLMEGSADYHECTRIAKL